MVDNPVVLYGSLGGGALGICLIGYWMGYYISCCRQPKPKIPILLTDSRPSNRIVLDDVVGLPLGRYNTTNPRQVAPVVYVQHPLQY
jgi:hypothetical protein